MKNIIYPFGSMLLIQSFISFICALLDLFYNGNMFSNFIFISIISLFFGYLSILSSSVLFDEILNYNNLLTIPIIWILFSFSVSLANMLIMKQWNVDFYQAIFEATSAISTTSITLLNVEQLPKSVLFWQVSLANIGGLGIIIMYIVIGSNIWNSSSLGGDFTGGYNSSPLLINNIIGKIIFLYFGITITCFISYAIFGMNAFDALLHAMSCVSTSGFSSYIESINHYDSAGIQITTIIFMAFGSFPLATIVMIAKKNLRPNILSEQVLYFIMIIFITTIMVIIKNSELNQDFNNNILSSLFNVMSCITTTGYSLIEPYNNITIYLFLMALTFIGGCSGSTAGGIKVSNFVLLIKSMIYNFKSKLDPRTGNVILMNKKNVSDKKINDISTMITSYLTLIIIGIFIFSLITNTSLSNIASWVFGLITTSGLNVDNISHYINASSFSHNTFMITSSILMLAGRLESVSLLILIFAQLRWINQMKRTLLN